MARISNSRGQSLPENSTRPGRLLRCLDYITRKAGLAAAFLILVLMALLTYEVIARYLFDSPTIWAMETSQLLMCVVVALGGGFSYLYGAHVNVDIVVDRFSERNRAIVELFTEIFVFIFVGFFLFKMGIVTFESLKMQETTGTYFDPPVYPVKILVVMGVFLVFLQVISRFIRTCLKVMGR